MLQKMNQKKKKLIEQRVSANIVSLKATIIGHTLGGTAVWVIRIEKRIYPKAKKRVITWGLPLGFSKRSHIMFMKRHKCHPQICVYQKI